MLDYQHFSQQTTFSMRNSLIFETNTQLTILKSQRHISDFLVFGASLW